MTPPLGTSPLGIEECVGELVAVHALSKDCVVLLGWSDRSLAGEGEIFPNSRRRGGGRYKALSWTLAQERWFVAVARAARIAEAGPGDYLRLQGGPDQPAAIFSLTQRMAEPIAFAGEIARRLGPAAAEAGNFLLEIFTNRAARELDGRRAFLAALLAELAEDGGAIELMGLIEGEGLLVQGWVRRPCGPDMFVQAGALDEVTAAFATFARTDLARPASGFIALIPAQAPGENGLLSGLQRLYLRSGLQALRLSVLPNATRLKKEEAVAQLRDMLPGLQGDPQILRGFRTLARARYAGMDTVSSLPLPVRMAIDLAVQIPEAGFYLTGWLLDPLNLVTAVSLHGAGTAAPAIDKQWTRVLRDDVTAGFAADPLFQGRIGHDLHGFTAFAPLAAPAGPAWLELGLANGESAFMPLAPHVEMNGQVRQMLLRSFDLFKPSAGDIVARQLGPCFLAASAPVPGRVSYQTLRAGRGAAAALIVPVTDAAIRTNVLAAEFALKPPGDGIALFFVCSPALGEHIQTLSRALAFYDLDATILLTDAPIGAWEAVEVGAAASGAAKLLALSPCTHALAAGWGTRLLAALGDGRKPRTASPTVYYEDWSIRFAGINQLRFLEGPPFVDIASDLAGYPRGWTLPRKPATTLAGCAECCAFTRSALDRLDGAGRRYALPGLEAIDHFLAMGAAGVTHLWVPDVEFCSTEDGALGDDYCARAGELVDGWTFRAVWEGRR